MVIYAPSESMRVIFLFLVRILSNLCSYRSLGQISKNAFNAQMHEKYELRLVNIFIIFPLRFQPKTYCNENQQQQKNRQKTCKKKKNELCPDATCKYYAKGTFSTAIKLNSVKWNLCVRCLSNYYSFSSSCVCWLAHFLNDLSIASKSNSCIYQNCLISIDITDAKNNFNT